MPVVAVDILLAVFVAAVGMGAGWLLRGNTFRKQTRKAPNKETNSPPDKLEEERKLTRNVLDQLHELADGMAANVDEHSSQMREINDELNATTDPNCVVSTIAKIMQANEAMQEQLSSAEQRLQEQAQQIEQTTAEARTDALTQLANRRAFDDAMQKAAERFQKHGRPVSVMILDVDHFKKFNDTHGHQAGDEVLRGVARVLSEAFSKTEVVARYGGEEFAVIFPGTAVSQARSAAERGRAAIADASFEFEGKTLKVSASGGLAELSGEESLDDLIRRADDALYAAKEAGRNCGYLHDGESNLPIMEQPKPEPKEAKSPITDEEAEEKTDPDRHDPVTGLSNRTVFCEDVNRRVAEWKRGGADVTVMLIQIDDYQAKVRQFEDDTVGTLLLRSTTQFLKAAMREMDHVARFDDDVFGLLLPGASLMDSSRVAERLRRQVESHTMSHRGQPLQFSISIGLAQACSGDTAPRLTERSQDALDSSVEAGGNATFTHNGNKSGPVSLDEVAALSAT